jgi:hypothetical protein
MTAYTEPTRPLEALLSEAPGDLSRESVTIPSGTAAFAANSVLGYRISATSATGVATTAGNGDFVAESVDADATAEAGVYSLLALSATKAAVYSPAGEYLGLHTVGTAWDADGIEFNTEGTWALGDTAAITVAHTQAVGLYNATGPVIGMALYPVDASSAAKTVACIVRHAAVKAAALQWEDAENDSAAGLAELAANFVIAR